jgi:D-hydroxyproline dehydrogenase subunit gamma
MPDSVVLTVDGSAVTVPPGATVAVAVLLASRACRRSVGGEPRGPLCAMGICFECRVTIEGRRHRRSCQVLCQPGMAVSTDG